jgi:hypothetical protein
MVVKARLGAGSEQALTMQSFFHVHCAKKTLLILLLSLPRDLHPKPGLDLGTFFILKSPFSFSNFSVGSAFVTSSGT